MISILIPVKNYDLAPLVNTLLSQLAKLEINWEILFCEDGSDYIYVEQNKALQKTGVQQYHFKQNRGRNRTRDFLARQAKGDHLLFMDADTLPFKDNYIKTYLNALEENPDMSFFGGIQYEDKEPPPEQRLRWAYGREKESRSAADRNRSPYRSTLSGNMLVPRTTFRHISPFLTGYDYGSDIALGTLLKKGNQQILHLDNPVYHRGLESNASFLKKTREAIDTLIELHCEGNLDDHEHLLMNGVTSMHGTGMLSVCANLYVRLHDILERRLQSKYPSVKMLQVYKLFYACYKFNRLD